MYVGLTESTGYDFIVFTGPEYVGLYHRPRAASPCGGNSLCISWTAESRVRSLALGLQ